MCWELSKDIEGNEGKLLYRKLTVCIDEDEMEERKWVIDVAEKKYFKVIKGSGL